VSTAATKPPIVRSVERQPEKLPSWRDEEWQLETPTTVRELLRQNPIGPAFWLVGMCFFTICGFAAPNTLHLPIVVAIPLGLVGGTVVWWLFMFAFAKGWIEDE
jgi:hypothetical protein